MDPFTIALATFGVQKLRGKSTKRALRDAAIIGGGEELHMEFPVLHPPPQGLSRYFVLDFRGWAKDMDLYTKDGETVTPLPVPAYADDIRREILHSKYNVRFQEGF